VSNPDPAATLLAIEQIKQLKARYFRLMDTKQWEAWGGVFADDVVMDVPEADMVVTGRAEVVAFVSGALGTARTAHHGHMPEIELTGPDTARGVWAMFDSVDWERPDGTHGGLTGFGHYTDDYRHGPDGWQIARTRLDRLRVDYT